MFPLDVSLNRSASTDLLIPRISGAGLMRAGKMLRALRVLRTLRLLRLAKLRQLL